MLPSRVQIKDVGIVLGHGSDAAEWKGRVLTEIAVALAASGALYPSELACIAGLAPPDFTMYVDV